MTENSIDELTYEEIIKIYKDLMVRNPISVPGEKAKKYAEKLRVEMDEIIAKGGFFEIPKEW